MELRWEITGRDGSVTQGTDQMPSASVRAQARIMCLWVPGKWLPYTVRIPEGGALIFFMRHRQHVDVGTMKVVRKEAEVWLGSRVGRNKKVLRITEDGKATRLTDDGKLITLRREGVCNRCGKCCEGCVNLIPPNTCKVWDEQPPDKGCRVWPPHPFERPPYCSYIFIDEETGELVECYKDRSSLEVYAPAKVS